VTDIQPGDFALVPIRGSVGFMIRVGQWLNGDGFGKFEHAFIYIGGDQIVQAMPGGAQRVPLEEWGDRALWSSNLDFGGEPDEHGPLTGTERSRIVTSALTYVGVPYSFLDYLSIALARLGLRPRWLKRYIASTGHMICSQLVDQCYQNAGVKLFSDGRLPGDVTPADLAELIFDHEENDDRAAARDDAV
jgi:cell wall-associated NlpC family hydrolase